MGRPFRDRSDAGEQLAARLLAARGGDIAARHPGERPVVLGLPRGGVIVAAVVADRLGADLDVLVARKVGAPGHEEFGIGAVAESGAVVLDEASVRALGLSDRDLEARVTVARDEVAGRVTRLRGDRPRVVLTGRDVIVVDDGLATGVTARVALAAVAAEHPARITLAVPVAPPDAAARVGAAADSFVTISTPPRFRAVGEFYVDFDQTTDDEVIELLS